MSDATPKAVSRPQMASTNSRCTPSSRSIFSSASRYFTSERPALIAQLGQVGCVDVLGGRAGELGLTLVVTLAGQDEIGDREIRLHAREGLVEGRA